jgi:ketosteroid isomerase-like protein
MDSNDVNEECLIHVPYQDLCEPLPVENTSETSSARDITATTTITTLNIVQECYAAWNRRDMKSVVACFDDDFQYQDSLYFGIFTKNKDELERHLTHQMDLLPSNSQLIVDHIANDSVRGTIAAQWHVATMNDSETDGNSAKKQTTAATAITVPFTKGVSFYTINRQTGLIATGYRVSEMLVKPNKQSVNRITSFMSSSLFPQEKQQELVGDESSSDPSSSSSSKSPSIIERYFEAWNRRDFDAAVDCFVNDCTYQTEDPVFVDALIGKPALREHLVKNAASLPPSCQIILDQMAMDASAIGICWHLQFEPFNGFSVVELPNLRGCSMYTIDPVTGLLKTGFDVIESPIKLPRQVLPFLEFPARLLFGGSGNSSTS